MGDTKKDIRDKDHRQIHQEALNAVKDLKNQEARLIDILQEVDDAFTYRQLGYNSLYQYGVQALHLSEYQAYTYISVARKTKVFPRLKAAIKSGEVSVSKARRISSVLNEKDQTRWIDLAKTSTARELEKHVAKENPRERVPEKAKYLTDTLLQVQLSMDEQIYEKLVRARDLESSKSKRHMSLEQTLDSVLEFYLSRKDPVEKAKRSKDKRHSKTLSSPTPMKSVRESNRAKLAREESNCARDKLARGESNCARAEFMVANAETHESTSLKKQVTQKPIKWVRRAREPISSAIRHHLYLRSQGQCEFKRNGKRCKERKWLDVHHIKPIHCGGGNGLSNLMIVCRGHHRALHKH